MLAIDTDLEERIHAYPRRRTYLLPALHDVHDAYGWLPPQALEAVGTHLRVPKSEVFGIASSFPDFVLEEPAPHTTRACLGASCRERGAVAAGDAWADCLFICGVGPAAEVDGRLVGHGGLRSPAPAADERTLVQDGTCSRACARHR